MNSFKQLPPSRVIEVEGKLYQVQFSEITPYQQPEVPQKYASSDSGNADPMSTILTGGALIAGTFIVSLLLARAFMPAQTAPVVIQPQPPAPRRNYTKDCRPVGLFGWNTVCEEREFWQ